MRLGKSSFIVIHANSLPNQKLYSEYLHKGFARLGFDCEVTSDPIKKGDVHVCIGPHFALRYHLGGNTIHVDRCLWGDDLKYVTIGWVNNDGGMKYPTISDGFRPKPKLKEWKRGRRNPLYLIDYGIEPSKDVIAIFNPELRYHPAVKKSKPLVEQLENHDFVIGHRSSALVTALVEGCPAICLDSRSPAYNVSSHDFNAIIRPDREQWLNNLSYAQWSGQEIASGDALEYVLNNYQSNK